MVDEIIREATKEAIKKFYDDVKEAKNTLDLCERKISKLQEEIKLDSKLLKHFSEELGRGDELGIFAKELSDIASDVEHNVGKVRTETLFKFGYLDTLESEMREKIKKVL